MARTFASGDYIQWPWNAAFDAQKVTAAIWIKTTDTGTSPEPPEFFGHHSPSSSVGGWNLIFNGGNINNGLVTAAAKITGGSGSTWSFSIQAAATPINDGNWHHVALSFQNVNGGPVALYIDGVVQASTTSSGTFTYTGSDVVRLGQSVDTFWRGFIGTLGEAAIWNDLLTQDEVTALYHGASPTIVRPTALVLAAPLRT